MPEETAVQEEPKQEAPAQEPAQAAAPTPEAKPEVKEEPKVKSHVSKSQFEINQLWKETKIKEQKIKELESQLAKTKAEQAISTIKRPERDQFETEQAFFDAYDKYTDARIETKTRQLEEQKQKQYEDAKLEQDFKMKWAPFHELASSMPEEEQQQLAEVISSEPFLDEETLTFIRLSPVGPQIFAHLGLNRPQADSMINMDYSAKTRELRNLQATFIKSMDTKKTTTAPPPITPVGGTAVTPQKDLNDVPWDEFVARRRKEVQARKKGLK